MRTSQWCTNSVAPLRVPLCVCENYFQSCAAFFPISARAATYLACCLWLSTAEGFLLCTTCTWVLQVYHHWLKRLVIQSTTLCSIFFPMCNFISHSMSHFISHFMSHFIPFHKFPFHVTLHPMPYTPCHILSHSIYFTPCYIPSHSIYFTPCHISSYFHLWKFLESNFLNEPIRIASTTTVC